MAHPWHFDEVDVKNVDVNDLDADGCLSVYGPAAADGSVELVTAVIDVHRGTASVRRAVKRPDGQVTTKAFHELKIDQAHLSPPPNPAA